MHLDLELWSLLENGDYIYLMNDCIKKLNIVLENDTLHLFCIFSHTIVFFSVKCVEQKICLQTPVGGSLNSLTL